MRNLGVVFSLLFSLLLQLFLSSSSLAGIKNWTLTGLGDQPIQALVIYKSTLYAGTKSGVYYYSASQALWKPVSPATFGNQGVESLLAFKTNLYAGTSSSGVKVYSMATSTWTQVKGMGATWRVPALASYAIDGINTLFAGAWFDGVFKLNAETNELSIFSDELINKQVRAMTTSTLGFYVATGDGGGVYLLTSNGWVAKSVGLSDKTVSALAFYKGVLYAGTEFSHIFSYDANAAKWSLVGDEPANKINALIEYNGKLYAGTNGDGVWSYDGKTWELDASFPQKNVLSFAVSGNKLYAGTTAGVFEIQDITPDLYLEKINAQENQIDIDAGTTISFEMLLGNKGTMAAQNIKLVLNTPEFTTLAAGFFDKPENKDCKQMTPTRIECVYASINANTSKIISYSLKFAEPDKQIAILNMIDFVGMELSKTNNQITYAIGVKPAANNGNPPPPPPKSSDLSLTDTFADVVQMKVGESIPAFTTVTNTGDPVNEVAMFLKCDCDISKIIISELLKDNICEIADINTATCMLPPGSFDKPFALPFKFNVPGEFNITEVIYSDDTFDDNNNNDQKQHKWVVTAEANPPASNPPVSNPPASNPPVSHPPVSNPPLDKKGDGPGALSGQNQTEPTGKGGCSLQHQQTEYFNFTQFVYWGFVFIFLGLMRKKIGRGYADFQKNNFVGTGFTATNKQRRNL